MTLLDRFLAKIQKTETCWLWTAGRCSSKATYGAFYFEGRDQPAHRVSWILRNGTIPKGLHVLHHCDTPLCVNPEHLFLGTPQDNMTDKVKKNRQFRPAIRWVCPSNHDKRVTGYYLIRGKHICKICVSITNKIQREKRKNADR